MKKYLVCPECLELDSLVVIRETAQWYQYSPDKLDFDGMYYGEPTLIKVEPLDQKWVYCSKCNTDIDTSEYLSPEDLLANYLVEVDDTGHIIAIGKGLKGILTIGQNLHVALKLLKEER